MLIFNKLWIFELYSKNNNSQTLKAMTFFIASLILYYAAHSILADNQVKKWLTTHLIAPKWYRINFNIFAIISLLAVVFLYKITPKDSLFDSGYFNQIIGSLLMLTGVILLKKAMRNYDLREFSGTAQLKNKGSKIIGELNTAGFNQYVRHPLYFAALFIFWGLLLAIPNTGVLAITFVSTAYLIIGTKLEEQKLVQEFGDAYLNYQKEVPMLIPRFKF